MKSGEIGRTMGLQLKEKPALGWNPGAGRTSDGSRPPVALIVAAWRRPSGEASPVNVLSIERRVAVFEHLMECGGVRSTSRLTGVSPPAVLRVLRDVGRGYRRLHDRLVRNLNVIHVEADELHSYVGVRQKNLRPGHPADAGEHWIWTAIARHSKIVISYRVAKREQSAADAFMLDLRSRLATIPVLSTDAFAGYPQAVGGAFCDPDLPGGGVDYAQVVKSFAGRRRDYDKVAPAAGPPRVAKRVIWGSPDLSKCGTSIGERENCTLRAQIRRLVRRGTGFSKRLDCHEAAIDCFVGWYNWVRVHSSLRVTPAMEVGIATHVWSTAEFIEACLSEPEGERPKPGPLAPREEPKRGAERVTSTGFLLRAVPSPAPAGKGPTVAKAPGAPKPASPPPKLREAPKRGEQLSLFDDPPKGDGA